MDKDKNTKESKIALRELNMPSTKERTDFINSLWANRSDPDWVIPIYNDCLKQGIVDRTISNMKYCYEPNCTSCRMLKVFNL